MKNIKNTNNIIFKQKKELLEIFTTLETKNKYEIYLDNSTAELFAAEVNTGFFNRNFLKSYRPFKMIIKDKEGKTILTLRRLFRFIFQEMKIYEMENKYLGKIKQRFSFINKKYEIYNNENKKILDIQGPLLHPWTFHVKDNGRSVGTILKRWTGALKEVFSDSDNFGLEIKENLSTDKKLLLIGAVFLLDYVYFENNNATVFDFTDIVN